MKLNVIESTEKYPFTLPALPFGDRDLDPYITSNTLQYHYNKHHQGYVNNLNALIKDTEMQDKTIEEIICLSAKDATKTAIFNNAAQVWNHTFYWHCMKKNGGGRPNKELLDLIARDFGSFDAFITDFKQAAISQFGSGWAWLTLNQSGKMSIVKTSNADLPMSSGLKALLTIDVWEHAYYLDYQNKRIDYVDLFIEHLVNWDFVYKNVNY